jgi:hypothetical protein
MGASAILVHALFFGFLTAWLAVRKSYRAAPWFALGVLLGAIATFLLYLQPDRVKPADAPPSPDR